MTCTVRNGVHRALLIPLFLGVAGCAGVDRNIDRVDSAVSEIAVGDPADVSAMDLARAMLVAGFSPQDVLRIGPSVRNSLARSGGAQVQDRGVVLALFSVMEDKLYITSQSRGTFVHPLNQALMES